MRISDWSSDVCSSDLYYNKDAFAEAGLDPDAPPKTWGEFGEALDALKAAGSTCPFTTAWQSWVHLETFSAWHDVPFATQENGFGGLDAELVFNGPLQVKHIQQLGDWRSEEHTSELQSLMRISYAV